LTRARAGADDRAVPSERVSRLVETLLGQAEEAILRADWFAAAQKTRSVLALLPGHQDALAYLEAAERTRSPILPCLHAGQLSAINWTAALARYRYPVDLRGIHNAPDGFFGSQVDGDRSSTIAFEERFRTLAPGALEPWYEVIFWKIYSQPVGPRLKQEERLTGLQAAASPPGTFGITASNSAKSLTRTRGKRCLRCVPYKGRSLAARRWPRPGLSLPSPTRTAASR
jgi:hypothetical protein